MTASEKMFKFPFRIFESADNKSVYVIGYRRVHLESIMEFSDYSEIRREAEEVKERGFDSTAITMADGEEYVCSWKRERFEKEFDKHTQLVEEFLKTKQTKTT